MTVRTEARDRRDETRRAASPARWLLWVVLVLAALAGPTRGSAQTGDRAAYMINMLATSSAFRVRAQAALRLGEMPSTPAIVQALVTALRDSDATVRAAAATSLGRVGDTTAISALRGLSSDSAPPVRSAATAAITAIQGRGSSGTGTGTSTGTATGTGTGSGTAPSGPARFYVGVGDPGSTVAGIDPSLLTSARSTAVSSVTAMSGVVLAPQGESASAARSAIGSRHLRGYYLDISIIDLTTRPDGSIHAAVSVVVQDYPSHNIRSMLSGAATASGVSGVSGQRAVVQAAIQSALRGLSTAMVP